MGHAAGPTFMRLAMALLNRGRRNASTPSRTDPPAVKAGPRASRPASTWRLSMHGTEHLCVAMTKSEARGHLKRRLGLARLPAGVSPARVA